MKYTVSITAWYLNSERICQLINSQELIKNVAVLNGVSGSTSIISKEGIARSVIKQQLEAWLHQNKIPSLGELIVTNKPLTEGTLFTIYQDFYGRGLSKYNKMIDLPRNAVAELHNSLPYEKEKKIRIIYSPKNLVFDSSWSRLGGHTKLFCFCYIESSSDKEIIARPYLIGDLHTGLELETPNSWNELIYRYGDVHFTAIDQFSLVKSIYESEKSAPDIKLLKDIPEIAIKTAIAEIINEANIPKDWGGERSDLFSCNLSLNGKRIPSAFLLKGPAKFSEMKMTHLGKNGDQIDRLFSEPADLLILQHCHKVSTPVRSTLRAFASRIHDLRYFSIIDGYDTVRLLKAYNKCGL